MAGMAPLVARIVLVETDEQSRRRLQDLLARGGHHVISAGDLAGLKELVRAERPDLVLSGLDLPFREGHAVLESLRSDPATARCPVVFLPRPFSGEALLGRIERILESRAGPDTPPVRFEALDAEEDHPPGSDPARLPLSAGRLPSFESLPGVLRDVLVVDDNAPFRGFLRDLLSAHGFTVHEAADGEEGLRVALESRPWLILADVRMPGGDGFEFCRRVRSHSLLRQTPFLFLSGWDDYQQRYRGLGLGADDFLSKETSVRELLIRIQLLLKRYTDLSRRQEAGMGGELEVIGVPALLQVCHLSRLSGVLEAEDGARKASLRFREGEIVGAECGAAAGREAVFAFLAWERGRFRLAPGRTEGIALGASFNQLLLEGCRRLDESRRAGPS